MSEKIKQQMKDEFKTEIEKGYITLEEIQDNSGEWVDGYLPVYYNKIVEEWQEMPSEYNDRGHQELGHLEQEVTIYNLMSLDLYLYYTDIFNDAIAELEEELEMAE
jgi:flavodoxin